MVGVAGLPGFGPNRTDLVRLRKGTFRRLDYEEASKLPQETRAVLVDIGNVKKLKCDGQVNVLELRP